MAVQIPFPLPSKGFALNSKVRVNLDYIVDQFNQFNTGTATWDQVSVGIANSETGTITLYNSSNANYFTIQAGATASSVTYTLPTSLPGSTPGVLTSDTSGVMSWKTSFNSWSLGTASTTSGTLIFYDSSNSHTLTLQPGATAADTTFTLPTGVPAQANSLIKVSTGGVMTMTDHSYSITSASNGLLNIVSGVAVDVLANSLGTEGMVTIGTSGTAHVKQLLGTSNEIIVTVNTNDFTLTTPQAIGTASNVQFGSVKVSAGSYASPGFFFASSSSNVVGTYAASDGTAWNLRVGGAFDSIVFSVDNTGLGVATGELRAPTIRGTTNLKVSTSTGHIATIQGPSGASADYTLTLPNDTGSNHYLLSTDGMGNLSWASVAATGGATTALDNLASVAVNTAILPGTDNSIALGSASKQWTSVYLSTSVICSATSNQLVLGATRTATITAPTPATSSRTYTFPDLSGDYSVVGTIGTQTIAGAKTFSSAVAITATSNHLVLSTSSNTLTISAATQATSARTWTIPDVSGNGTFAALEGTQTFSGSKTFSAATTFTNASSTAVLAQSSNSGGIVGIFADNSSNTASSRARLTARVAGTSAGDPFVLCQVVGGSAWAFGTENSSGSFKISHDVGLGSSDTITATSTGSVVLNNAALTTTATDGFLYITSCAGTPSGTPTAFTGRIPMVYDTTHDSVYFYNSAWKAFALDSGVVHITGTETISGAKTFSAATLFPAGSASAPGVAVGDAANGLYRSATNQVSLATNGTQGLIQDSGQDVYNVAWQDYSGTSTIVGWSSRSSTGIYYKKVGKLVFVMFRIFGTSNSAATSFTVPYNSGSTVPVEALGIADDNGVALANPTNIELVSGSNVVNVYKNYAATAWSTSGTKDVWGQFFYQAA